MNVRLKPIMFVGTCSDAGKSVINAAFCRIFKQDGYHPAPFKAQNMSLNSYSTPEGGEMGRAQVVQAEACGIAPHTDMNPVLLKPTNDKNSQVVLNGRPVGNMSARDYFGMQNQKEELFKEATEAFHRLESRYSPIVLEGAGSISELNLRDRDITNMRMAEQAGAATFLVADIDRGGVFGSVYGTIALLKPEERALMKGIIINKFRGDVSLFDDGRKIIEDLTGMPVVGVIPWFCDIKIEEEDSVALDMKHNTYRDGKINVAIILLKRMSNFTDFDILDMDPRFNAYYTNNIDEIEKADIILIPGSKNTLSDLQSLRACGIADAIIRAHKNGKKVIGICGGYQMMGEHISDPEGMENGGTMKGMGLLPVTTRLKREKVRRQVHGTVNKMEGFFSILSGLEFNGYEIHVGDSGHSPNKSELLNMETAFVTGRNKNVCGTYIHGIFDRAAIATALVTALAENKGLSIESCIDYKDFKEKQYDKLADILSEYLNMEEIYGILREAHIR